MIFNRQNLIARINRDIQDGKRVTGIRVSSTLRGSMYDLANEAARAGLAVEWKDGMSYDFSIISKRV